MSLAEIDPRLPDIAVTVAASDRVDDALDAVDHPRPIDLDVLDRDPEPAGGAGLMKRTSGTDERLRRIAPGVEAGATNFPLLDHGHARALTACFGGGGTPGGASADDDQIVWCAGTRQTSKLLARDLSRHCIDSGRLSQKHAEKQEAAWQTPGPRRPCYGEWSSMSNHD